MTRLLILFYILTKYYRNMSKGVKVMDRTRMSLRTDGWTDGRHNDRYIPEPIGRRIERYVS